MNRRWIYPLLLAAIVLGLWLPLSPAYRPVPSDDPSVYLYVGKIMLDGGLPYRAAWDHKQPLAYALYAGAIALGRSGGYLGMTPLWGLWLIELAGLLITALFGYAVLRRVVSDWLAATATGIGLLALTVIIWAYSLEEYALPLQIATVWVFARIIATNRTGETGWAEKRRWTNGGLIIGLLTGVCFFLKQSLIGAGAAVGAYLLVRLIFKREGRVAWSIAGMVAGFGLVSAGVLGYLASNRLLADYRAAALDFNFMYANLGPLERAQAVIESILYMAGVPGLLLALVLWLPAAWITFRQQGPELSRLLCQRWSAPVLAGLGAGAVILSLAGELIGSEPGLGLVQWLLIGSGVVLLGLGGLLWPPRLRKRVAGWLENGRTFPLDSPRGPLFSLAVLYLPAALVLMTLSGRSYVYYYIACIPPLILLAGLVGGWWIDRPWRLPLWLRSGVIGLIVVGVAFQPLWMVIGQFRHGPNPEPEIGRFIVRQTHAEDTILAWGKDTTYTYYLSQRAAPSRYFYQAPIFLESYNERFHVVTDLLADLKARPPALFLIPGKPLPTDCAGLKNSPKESQNQVFGWVCENYKDLGQVDEFRVYGIK